MSNHTNFTITAGDTQDWGISLKDGTGAAKNITGWTIYFTAKQSINDADEDAVISIEVTDHEDAVNGLSSIPFSSADTGIAPSDYRYDVRVKTDTDKIYSIFRGTLLLEQPVRRSL